MFKKYFTREVKIGILAVASGALLFYGLNFLNGVNIFKPTNYFCAQYDSIAGLEETAPVLIKGCKVGQVREITYDFTKTPAFTISLDINKDLNLPVGTRAELFDNGALGGKAIRLIYPESAEKEFAFHAIGDTLNAQLIPGVFSKVEKMMAKIDNLASTVDTLVLSLHKITASKQLQNSMASIEQSSKNLEETSASLKTVMGNEMPKIVKNVKNITTDFSVLSNNMKDVDVAKTMQGVDATMNGLQSVTQKMNSKEGSLGLLINDRSLYDNLTNTGNNASQLMVDLKANPKRYVHFSIFAPKTEKK